MQAVGRDLATLDEVANALRALSPADHARLSLLARVRARQAPGLDWQDLLQESVAKALDGRRQWPRRLSFIVFLRETMRSEASEYVRRRIAGPVINETDLAGSDPDQSPFNLAVCSEPGPDRIAEARDGLARVRSMFADDQAVLAVIAGLAIGASPEEIQRAATLSAAQYAAAQKRLRRRLIRHDENEGRTE